MSRRQAAKAGQQLAMLSPCQHLSYQGKGRMTALHAATGTTLTKVVRQGKIRPHQLESEGLSARY